ncbi:MalY/PatB family protein [Deinococcus aquiradiocola]|uniref:cysteine-S-conjugate beta-lyase n=1 Tax=Deinococcus aquiradiocola TaxID=393059 RepID=A0A917UKL3_9DEIO|nr:PatB family C-S lyase [Deinococcus aquiradiocola]GGJ64212.1 aminotransferase class I [Deinococcus aquiradiocola]
MSAPSFLLTPDELRHRDSSKWQKYPADVLPLWVADMDYAVSPFITAALQDRLTRGLGYFQLQDEPQMAALLRARLAGQGVTDLPDGGVRSLPGVVPGLYAAVLGLTAPGDDVISMTPIYPPFMSAVRDHGRNLRAAPLAQTTAGWTIDWGALEAAVTPQTRLFMLCHPHNPTGRVWTRAELERLADFVLRHDLLVVTDELHADLTYPVDGVQVPHTAFVSVNAALRERTVTLTGPCKAYNTAGLGIGAAVSHATPLLDRMGRATAGVLGHASALSMTMWEAALEGGRPWLDAVLAQLLQNRDLLTARLAAELPWVGYHAPEATYLAWLDFRAHPRHADIHAFLLSEARVALNDGPTFAPDAQGFVRLNFATSPAILNDAIDRIVAACRLPDA